MAKHIPYPLLWDKMPIDISGIFESEKPAGKHGFLTVKDENFVFENGTKVKFWGTNFNSGANFPEHLHSEKVAKRLAMVGLNMVRLHQLDAHWSTPNIFQFSKGTRLVNTKSFDPESMDRLDYLIYCLKNEGIYIYMDFLTYRRFREGDGVVNADLLPEGGKPYCAFDRVMIELQKKFNYQFLEHINPYTNLAYKDEPCIAMAEVVNESDIIDKFYYEIEVEPYKTRLLKMYRDYAVQNGKQIVNEDFVERTDQLMREFLFKVQQDYYIEMIDDLRKAGAKFPITGTNRSADKTTGYSNSVTDFTDSHTYWRLGDQSGFLNDSHMKSPVAFTRELVKNTFEGKPFFVSEWDTPLPNEYRADSTLFMAAIGALQDWKGFTIHTYRYGTSEYESVTCKVGRDIAIGGSHYRGLFDTYNDPAKFGLFYHAALITRRGDVLPSKKKTIISLSHDEMMNFEPMLVDLFSDGFEERQRICFAVDTKSEGETFDDSPTRVSDTGEIFRDPKKGYGFIDTPRTKAVYGFVGEQGKIELDGVSIETQNDFATIALSSLTNDGICESNNMLLTAIGRADNTDCKYNANHTVQLYEGHAPVLIEVIEARIGIKTKEQKLKVWAVDYEGYLIGLIPTEYIDGILSFIIGKQFESMYYLIELQ